MIIFNFKEGGVESFKRKAYQFSKKNMKFRLYIAISLSLKIFRKNYFKKKICITVNLVWKVRFHCTLFLRRNYTVLYQFYLILKCLKTWWNILFLNWFGCKIVCAVLWIEALWLCWLWLVCRQDNIISYNSLPISTFQLYLMQYLYQCRLRIFSADNNTYISDPFIKTRTQITMLVLT